MKPRAWKFVDFPSNATCYPKKHTDWPQLSRTVHVLNRFYWTDWLKASCIVSSRSTLHYITLHYITLHFWAFLRFFSGIHIFSRLYNLPPRQAFWSSRRPDSLAMKKHLLGEFSDFTALFSQPAHNMVWLYPTILNFQRKYFNFSGSSEFQTVYSKWRKGKSKGFEFGITGNLK